MDAADRLVATTLDLVRIPSPSGREEAAAEYVEHRLGRIDGVSYLRRHGAAVVAVLGADPAAGGDAPPVTLVGHLDTVPENSHPEPARRGDDLVGLGTTDMKGALAVMLELAADRPAGALPLGLVFYDCEEVSFERNGLRPLLDREPWLARTGLALLMEPTDNVLELGCLGTLHAQVTFHGEAAHSARPWTGRNAILEAVPFLERLRGLEPRDVHDGPAHFREVVSVTLAQGGRARNVIPDAFTLTVNLRFPPDRTGEEAVAYIEKLVPDHTTMEIVDLAPAAPARFEAPALKRLAERFELACRAKQAWTDVAQFAGLGVPAANFGPGIPELAHKREESIPVANLVRSHAILHEFLGGDSR
jgi:succinyl-diaminopimelate desuccinylase